ncbi:Protein fuzzy [Blattella germanica]|nr:Protein fuzzy [Blattella germanica]
MVVHVMCLTASGGLPLFTRRKGEGEPLPFSVVASLNGVHMFGNIMLIAAACGASKMLLDQLLTSVFNAMVMAVGIEELRSPRNAERLKRDLRNLLDAWAECVDSLYGCLMIRGRVAVATSSWWQLHAEEKKLLALLVSLDGTSTACDIPVPFRLVVCTLVAGVQVCALCGPSPSLTEVEHVSLQCWKTAIDILRAADQCCPRNFPPSVQLDTGVMGLLLVERQAGKFLLSRNQRTDAGKKEARSLSGAHRLDVLRTFYHQVAATFMSYSESSPEGATSCEQPSTPTTLETYWCSEYHKCHALRHGSTLLCVLYASAVPIHTMRLVAYTFTKSIPFSTFVDNSKNSEVLNIGQAALLVALAASTRIVPQILATLLQRT